MESVRRLSASRRRNHSNLSLEGPRCRSQERSITYHDNSVRKSLDRGISDPFDAPTDDVSSASETEDYQLSLPTLPRYPVGDTRDLNCWLEPDSKTFRVRGTDYLLSKRKVVSGPYLLRARGCDVLLEDNPPQRIGNHPGILGGNLRKLPTFIINLRFPWGFFVFYFEIPSLYCPFLAASQSDGAPPPSMEGMTAAEKNLAKFFMGNDAYRNDRLKLIPHVVDGPWVARSIVTGKPAIIGNKLPVTYTFGPREDDKAEFLEAALDIGSSSKAAKRIVSVCRRYMNLLTSDVGFVIEGKTKEEMPEQMMGAVRIIGADPLKAPQL